MISQNPCHSRRNIRPIYYVSSCNDVIKGKHNQTDKVIIVNHIYTVHFMWKNNGTKNSNFAQKKTFPQLELQSVLGMPDKLNWSRFGTVRKIKIFYIMSI